MTPGYTPFQFVDRCCSAFPVGGGIIYSVSQTKIPP